MTSSKNFLGPGGNTIVIKAQGENGREEVEEIELDEAASHFLAQFVERNQGDIGMTPVTNEEFITGDIVVNVQEEMIGGGQVINPSIIPSSPMPSGGGNGSTYLINSETGELQLIQVAENVPGVGGGEEVEVVTFDSNTLTSDDGGEEGEQQQGQNQNQPLLQYNAFLDKLRNVGKSQVTRSRKVKPSLPRLRSAPALLRSSRRTTKAQETGGGGGVDDKDMAGSDDKPSPTKPARQPPIAGTSKGKTKTSTSLRTLASDNSPGGRGKVEEGTVGGAQQSVQEVYFIYRNSEGEQVAQIVDPSRSPFLDSSMNTVLCQFENSTMVFRQEPGGLPVVIPKAPKAPKKKPVRKPRPPAPKKETAAKVKKGGSTELKCMEKGCSNVAYNILELRKHLTREHDIVLDSEKVTFPSDEAFKEWREQYERERMVSFIYRGGTKKISKVQAVTYMICHRSGHYKPTMADESKRKRKMKPQGSCKIGGYCTAGIKLLKDLDNGEVLMDICHTHYGHPLDSEAIPHLRVNPVLRKIIQKKFEEGMTFPQMLAYIHHNPDRLEGLRMVDRRAVRNIYDTWRGSGSNQRKVNDGRNLGGPLKAEGIQIDLNDDSNSGEGDQVEVSHTAESSQISATESMDDPAEYYTYDDDVFVAESLEKAIKMENKMKLAERSDGRLDSEDDSENTNSNDNEETAPILQAVNEDESHEVDSNDDDDTSLPILVAVESLAVPLSQASKRKGVKKGKKCEKRRKLEVESEDEELETLKEPHPVTISDESEDDIDNPSNPIASNSPNHEDDFGMASIQISAELEATIDRLHDHGESGPTILLYKPVGDINVKYGGFCRAFREDDFCLIIQTPVQRQILQMFPKIINFEILDKPKPNEPDLKLAYLSVLDDYREAIPVAWVVADSFCTRILNQLFRTLRYHCGQLRVQYIMAPKNTELLKSWTSHFSHKPKILQSEFSARRELRNLLTRSIPNGKIRNQGSSLIDEMINTKSPDNLKELKGELVKVTKVCPNGPAFVRKLEKEWFPRIQEWSLAYRTTNTSCNLLFVSDSFLRLKKFVGFKGTTKLNQTVDHILKVGYDKCFLRTKRMFKGDQKFCRVLEKVDKHHKLAKDNLKDAVITIDAVDGSKWTLTEDGTGEEEVKVEVTELKSPCDCKIICKACHICMHAYICSCTEFMEEHAMCPHIHKVHCFQLGKPLEGDQAEEMSSPIGKVPDHDGGGGGGEHQTSSTKIEMPISESDIDGSGAAVDADSDDDDGALQDSAVICEDGTEITFVSDSQIEGLNLNLTEVFQTASGLLAQNDGGGELPKIVSIRDADEDKIIYEGEGEVPVIFHF